MRLLDLTQNENTTVHELADTIALDPALTSKVLRFVNSPISGVSRTVTSLPHAVAMLGVRAVKLLALSLSFLSPRHDCNCPGFDTESFTMQSAICGIASRKLAELTKTDAPQEAFLAGLLSQIGRLMVAMTIPKEYAAVLEISNQSPTDLALVEQDELGFNYADIGARVLRRWRLPMNVCEAISQYRQLSTQPPEMSLGKILLAAESVAVLLSPSASKTPPSSDSYFEIMQNLFDMDHEQASEFLSNVASEADEMRQTLSLPPHSMRPLEELEYAMKERVAELSMAVHLEHQQMAENQEELMRRATTDALTGIGNRAALDARMSLELERITRSGQTFGLLMIDVDNFKAFNDTHGHQAGDCVLKEVAKLLDDNARKIDYVARYGGEEFAVIAPETAMSGLMLLAERLRQAVEGFQIPWHEAPLKVTISIGVAEITEVVSADTAPAIIKAADDQLYQAKANGRNCVCSNSVTGAALYA